MSELSKQWEQILKEEDLSMSRGSPDWLVFVEDTDTHQKERPRSVGKDGGILCRQYALGNKQTANLTCAECTKSFSSPRSHSSYCSSRCKQKAYRTRTSLRIQTPNSEETVNAPAE
jgi:hypothetical protein